MTNDMREALVEARNYIAADRDRLLNDFCTLTPERTPDRASMEDNERAIVAEADQALASIDAALSAPAVLGGMEAMQNSIASRDYAAGYDEGFARGTAAEREGWTLPHAKIMEATSQAMRPPAALNREEHEQWCARANERAITIHDQRKRIDELEAALRNISEGNLGDAPWQAPYGRVQELARTALRSREGGA